MWVLPFLYYHHAYPITTFYQEWGAMLLGVCALPLLLTARYWQAPEVPRIILLPIGFLLIVLVQFLMHRITNFDQLLLLALYLLWATLLIMLGQKLRVEIGLTTVATWLAVALVAGAELDALAGLLQHYRWHTVLDPFVTVKVANAVYGNTAQPNHFANYLALGMISLGLLFVQNKLKAWQAAVLAAPLLFVMVLSGSRSSWLYLFWMLASAWWWQRGRIAYRPLLHYAIGLLAGFVVMHLVVQIPWMAGVNGTNTMERMFGDAGGSGGIRLALWQESWYIFTQFPLLGAGLGQFGWHHFNLDVAQHAPIISGLYNNAHNLLIQVAVEMGLAGVVVLLGTVGLWVWGQHQQPRDLEHWWGYAILAVIGIHSMLEYPLWYAYFIGIAAIVLGLFDAGTFKLELRKLGRLSVAAMLLLGAVALYQAIQGYRKLELALTLHQPATQDASYTPKIRDALVEAHGYPLMSSYAELFMSGMIDPSVEHLDEKLALNERAMHFVPIASVVYREAWLLQLAGKTEEARVQFEKALWAWPGDFPAALNDLRILAQKDPAHFAPLLEFATQKNEEYQRAVRAR